MLLPLGTDRPLTRPTLVTFVLIGSNLLIHLVRALLLRFNPEQAHALEDLLLLNPAPGELRWWGFFSYQFLHADLLHLGGNMLFLYVFGPAVEDRFRRWGYLLFYLVGGAAAGLAHIVFEPAAIGPLGEMVIPPVAGASGSIACVTGAYLVLFPHAGVRVLLFFFVIGVYTFPAWVMIVAAVAKDIWSSATSSGTSNIAFAAHLGGYVYGAAIAFILLAFKVIPRETYDLFSIGRQAHRRRQFKELTSSGASPWLAAAAKVKADAASTEPEPVTAKRGEIARALSGSDRDRAAALYLEVLELRPSTVLSRNNQYDVANHLFACQKYTAAASAYELFVARYPTDREAAQVRLMLALINARYLNDPVRAKTLLAEVRSSSPDESQSRLAADLERELG